MILKIEKIISVTLFLAILATLLWQIISRKFLGNPATWGDELSRLLFVYLGILGCHLAQRDKLHVRIDALLIAFGNKFRFVMEILINSVMGFVFIWFSFLGFKILKNIGPNDSLVTLKISVSFLYVGIIILGLLMFTEMIIEIVNLIRKKEVL